MMTGAGEDASPSASRIETAVAACAARQDGVVTRAQLIAAGLSADAIHARLRSGRLLLLHRGVYLLGSLVGPLRPARYRERAAVLACGRGAAVSHWSALWLRQVLPGRPDGDAVHLVLPGGRCRRPGIVAHRVATLRPGDVAPVDGIPTTTLGRTILDLAAVAPRRELEQVIATAERLDLVDPRELLERLNGAGPRRGARPEPGPEPRRGISRVRSILTRATRPAFTRSEAEERFLDLVRQAELPEPEANVRLGGCELDFLWRKHGVAVEVDGFAYHSSRDSFEGDRARDLALAAAGVEVRRVTWRRLHDRPYAVIRQLASMLTRAEAQRGLSPLAVSPSDRSEMPIR